MTLIEELGAFVAGLDFEHIPDKVIRNVQDRLLDTLGICAAAVEVSDSGKAVLRFVQANGGHPEATVLGTTVRLPAASAALVNGTFAHSLDFDDTHLPSLVHPSAPMVPALIAEAECVGASGRDLLVALTASYEINCRLSSAQYDPEIRYSVMIEHGFHATSIIGAVAAAGGCARLRGLDSTGVMHSMAIACSMGAGLTESNRRGGASKQLNAGWAAHVAITAASMASHGVIGPQTVLEGRLGFVEAYCRGRWDKNAATSELGKRWDVLGVHFRPYPCNNFTQAVADAALMLREQGLRPRDIAHVVIGIADSRGLLVGDSIDQHQNPENSYRARFSAPYVFASGMAGGGGLGVGLEDFTDEALVDPVRRRICNQCEVVVDPQCNAVFPRQILAAATVETASGTRVHARVTENRGGPEKPLSAEEFDRKLRSTAGRSAGALRHAVEALPSTRAVDRLMNSVIHKATHATAFQGHS